MLESISFNLPCQKAQFEEASYSPYVRASLIALGSISFLVSMLIFYRVPGLNSLGMSGGWSFFVCGFAALLTGILISCRKNSESETSREVRLLGNRDVTQSVEPCPSFSPFDQFDNPLMLNLFSFFTPKTLVAVAEVSKQWKVFSEEESLWQCHCLRIINHPKPPKHSWRSQYKVLFNWTADRKQKKVYHTFCEPPYPMFLTTNKDKNFTLMPDNSCVEIFPDLNFPQIYKIGNLATRKIQTIDFSKVSNFQISDAHLHENIWAVVDSLGNVFCFDLTTTECIHSYPRPKEVKEGLFDVYYNGNDVIIFNSQNIISRNLAEEKEPLIIDLVDKGMSKDVISKNVCSTSNFVIACTNNCDVLSINKNDGTVKLIEEMYTYDLATTSDSYLALLDNHGDLKIYMDRKTELTLLYTMYLSLIEISPHITIQMFQNWVILSDCGLLKIWNVDTGKQIANIFHGMARGSFTLNAEKLIVKEERTYQIYPPSNYTFYDFSADIDIPDNKNSSWISNLLTSFMRNA